MGDPSEDFVLMEDEESSRVRGGVGGEWPGDRDKLERDEHC